MKRCQSGNHINLEIKIPLNEPDGHRGQDQSAGLIRSDYINHILHGTDVLRKIAKMPKWQPLCFIIYVMTINLVNHKNFGG